mmetsp:Transcript_17145/g.54873  ORF Transcript_17145/g.54873 Transcript_17145/m.54873 type:complete len:104 (-) Transcript_17145:300-611(-)
MWFLSYVVSILVSIWLVHYYAERKVHWGVQLIVAFSWSLGFSYFLAIPVTCSSAATSNMVLRETHPAVASNSDPAIASRGPVLRLSPDSAATMQIAAMANAAR